MKKKIVLFLALLLTIFLLSCGTQVPTTDVEDITQPTITDLPTTDSLSLIDYAINPIVIDLFSSDTARITFDDIIQAISDGNMTAQLIYDSRTDGKIAEKDDIYYPVNANPFDIRISPLDTFTEILTRYEYIEIAPLNEPVQYTFIFRALDKNGEKNEICVYVTRSCVRLAYNGMSDGKEYANINICAEYGQYIRGIIPGENGELATIW
jgi:hypothetical protein